MATKAARQYYRYHNEPAYRLMKLKACRRSYTKKMIRKYLERIKEQEKILLEE